MEILASYLRFCKNILLYPIAFLDAYFPERTRKITTTIDGEIISEEIIALPKFQEYAKTISIWGYSLLQIICFSVVSLIPKSYLDKFNHLKEKGSELINPSDIPVIMIPLAIALASFLSFYILQWCFGALLSILSIRLSIREINGLFAYIRAHMVLVFSIIHFFSIGVRLIFKGRTELIENLSSFMQIIGLVWYIYILTRISKEFFGQEKWLMACIFPLLPILFFNILLVVS